MPRVSGASFPKTSRMRSARLESTSPHICLSRTRRHRSSGVSTGTITPCLAHPSANFCTPSKRLTPGVAGCPTISISAPSNVSNGVSVNCPITRLAVTRLKPPSGDVALLYHLL